jgi:hypothetical protein
MLSFCRIHALPVGRGTAAIGLSMAIPCKFSHIISFYKIGSSNSYYITRVTQNKREGPGAKQFRHNQISTQSRISSWGPTNRPTNRPTDQRTKRVIEALCSRLKRIQNKFEPATVVLLNLFRIGSYLVRQSICGHRHLNRYRQQFCLFVSTSVFISVCLFICTLSYRWME